jgi:hypothetical protein
MESTTEVVIGRLGLGLDCKISVVQIVPWVIWRKIKIGAGINAIYIYGAHRLGGRLARGAREGTCFAHGVCPCAVTSRERKWREK